MGRKVLISATKIKKAISASNRLIKEKNNDLLIKAQGGKEKTKKPQYALDNVDFDLERRITRINFTQKQEYRTIERYITKNYVKYPIYSNWKIHEKKIKKVIKLTNSVLETLNKNEDYLIRTFANEILEKIGNPDIFPSWYLKELLQTEHIKHIKFLTNELSSYENEQLNTIKKLQQQIELFEDKLSSSKIIINIKKKKLQKREKKLEKIKNKKNNFFKTFFTLGFYKCYISKRNIARIENTIKKLNNNIEELNNNIVENEILVNKNIESIKIIEQNLGDKKKNFEVLKQIEEEKYAFKISKVQPLENSLKSNSDFIMLKQFNGYVYKKIIGCYIIHNRENDKYYVGQSKDIHKRIKQHFKGTKPNNVSFAEDYYNSLFLNKDEIFEIKIIECQTKDELDKMEKILIQEYDSLNSGYNKTSGNV